MRKIQEVLRLKFDLHFSDRDTGRSVKVARSTVQEYVKRARQAGLTWPLPAELTDLQLEVLLFQKPDEVASRARAEPNWAYIDRELHRKGMTRQLLWEEHHRQHPESVQYATFARNYRFWKGTVGLSMRQVHRAGEALFVDYAGLTLAITDPKTGVVHPGQVFVATLGASDYTYAEVTHPSRYEPDLNRAYAEFAEYYGVAVLPARVRKPKDKALVEVHVQIIDRRLLAPLRDQVYFSVVAANEALWPLLQELNRKPFQKRPGSRFELFTELDQPALRPLPVQPFEIASWKRTTVGLDYHVELAGHHYSVSYRHAKTSVDLRLTPNLVEVFLNSVRIAVHHRVLDASSTHIRQTTLKEHMPPHHQRVGEWTPQRPRTRAGEVGPSTVQLVEALLTAGHHPEQGQRSCQGLFKLAQAYGAERLEAACCRAVFLLAYSYRSVESILKHHLDELPLTPEDPAPRVADHANVRGPAYYRQESTEIPVALADRDFDPTLN
ncbi:IS21-like element ISPsy14 family transposase [Deinococcus rubellus]